MSTCRRSRTRWRIGADATPAGESPVHAIILAVHQPTKGEDMSVQLGELEGVQLLRKLDRQQKARAVLAESSAAPSSMALQAVAVAVCVAICSSFVERGSPSTLSIALTSGLVGAFVAMAIEQWKMRRRLDAVVALLKLDGDAQP
jgi:hypothetical protein